MKIIILVPLATSGRCYEKGDEVLWPDKADAERLCKAGYARVVTADVPQRK